jgi:hypothetical protein
VLATVAFVGFLVLIVVGCAYSAAYHLRLIEKDRPQELTITEGGGHQDAGHMSVEAAASIVAQNIDLS